MRTTRRILAAALLAITAASSWALPSLQQVEAAVKAGDYTGAETMTREVVAAKPNAAKAHYILAELMAHNRELTEAKAELDKAKELDPAIRFTAPEKFNSFQADLDASIARLERPRVQSLPEAALGGGDEPVGRFINFGVIVLCFIGVFYAFTWIFRRQDTTPNPLVSRPYSPAPSGPVGSGYAAYPQTIVQPTAGPSALHTGLAVAGGVVAGELLADEIRSHTRHQASNHRSDDDVANNASYSAPISNDNLSQRPIDFGKGNDWGDSDPPSSAAIDTGNGGGGGSVLGSVGTVDDWDT